MKILRIIFAIPLAILLSFIIPVINSFVLKRFIPWEAITNLLDDYFIPFSSGTIIIAFSYLITPKYKYIYSIIALLLCFSATYWQYTQDGIINYLFLSGSFLCFIFFTIEFYLNRKGLSIFNE